MNNARVKAVHDDDLEMLLTSLGVYESIVCGEQKCLFCNKSISIDNLGSIVPLNGTIRFSCNEEECLQKMIESGEGKK